MRKPVIAGNWKMYKTLTEAKDFVELLKGRQVDSSKVETIICAPALFLDQLVHNAKDSFIGLRKLFI